MTSPHPRSATASGTPAKIARGAKPTYLFGSAETEATLCAWQKP